MDSQLVEIAVITKVPKIGEGDGNLYNAVFTRKDLEDEYKDLLSDTSFIPIQLPVFKLGEILLLDHNDRDIFGIHSGGRKPSKWDVTYEVFAVDQAEAAIRRALEVRQSANPDDYPRQV